jgi:hypothetical protein
MKRVIVIVALVMGLALAAPLMAQSTDYSKMSTDQLYQLKQQPDNQHNMDLQSEWMKRAANMSPEQLKKYNVPYSQEEVQKMYRQRESTPTAD